MGVVRKVAAHQFYRFFVGDYLRDAGHLSLLEHGAYRRLIDLYMSSAEPLPFDMPRLYRLLHATSKEEQQAVQVVVEEFFHMDGMVLRHKRCDREIAWQQDLSEKAKAANQARWDRIKENQALASARIADAKRTVSEPEPEPEPLKDSLTSSGVAIPPCPVRKIVATYNEICLHCSKSKVPTPTLNAHISARWRQLFADGAVTNFDEAGNFMAEFFTRVNASRFLTGRAKARDGAKPFRASLRWLMKPENFAKVIEGEYDDELQRQA